MRVRICGKRKMIEEILIAGFGGQGVIFAGRLLSEAAMVEGKQVACSVSYGPEMRGGTANSSVIISDEPIGSLVVSRPTIAIIMNEPSMVKFEPQVRSGGLLIINQTLVSSKSGREDVDAIYIPATELATKAGNKAVANLILLGALVAIKPILSASSLVSALKTILTKEHPGLLALNEKALDIGLGRGSSLELVPAGSGGEKNGHYKD